MGTMFDTVGDLSETFKGLEVEAVAAYVNGKFANVAAAKAKFPHAHLLEIDVSGQGVGNAGDFEAGDMPYREAGTWARKRIAHVHRPVVYFQVSSWTSVIEALGPLRDQVRLWTAHYTGRPHLCSSACGFGVHGTADATQWGSAQARGTLPGVYANRNIDVSMTSDTFWAV
ncbi:hypothetical protein OJ997_00645 [Solirubrobacter phytolaccae]|uniref:Uncharacterized protein n=1 Tax=Solirubrobacter phytolaccae TaxID=1404360 RepID=A0A9X3N3I2_9ACTN|nr:hypothetical protein [Solirubrobacter phytolaccae]MDA0178786.1 hypothetical protein [Solirubrobacter phytolaccae]